MTTGTSEDGAVLTWNNAQVQEQKPASQPMNGKKFEPPRRNNGTILEAAFHDPGFPGFTHPQSKITGEFIRNDPDDETSETSMPSMTPSLASTIGTELSLTKEEEKQMQKIAEDKTTKYNNSSRTSQKTKSKRCWNCRRAEAVEQTVVQTNDYPELTPEEESLAKSRARAIYTSLKESQEKRKQERQARRDAREAEIAMRRKAKQDRKAKQGYTYSSVPEGVLVYRLDTNTRMLSLVSPPHSCTPPNATEEMEVINAEPGTDPSRRSLDLTTKHGTLTLLACDQHTAISWLEAIDLMLSGECSRQPHLHSYHRADVEEEYLNLAAYSHNLVRTGNVTGKDASISGIYYSVSTQRNPGMEMADETLEAIAKRRAVVKDSWDFYRMICSLLRDRRKYDEVFRRMITDPVYPYMQSMTGLRDAGGVEKNISQKYHFKYKKMSKKEICKDLIEYANAALPSLVEICKALAGSLGMEEVGVGPIKEPSSAIRKAERKYSGDILKVTDYCRALLVVKDFPTLLAVLELARDSFGPLIRRVKLSSLKQDSLPIPGGYRDVKINVELKEHICEIQIHLWPLWIVCGIDGFRHYRHCLEYSTDSFENPYEALDGLDRKSVAEMIVMAEEAVSEMPMEQLEWYHEKFILDYFAEVGLFLKHGLDVWAEITLRQLIRLRCESPDIGEDHYETRILEKYLEKALRNQNKFEEADQLQKKLNQQIKKIEKNEPPLHCKDNSLWETLCKDPFEAALEVCVDPSKKQREKESVEKKEIKKSKKVWRAIREERFKFLDENRSTQSTVRDDESVQVW